MQPFHQLFPDFTDNQYQQFEQLLPFYLAWNQKINVISRKDMIHFFEHHVLHSLSIAKWIRFTPGTKILDVGTGGGFPGIPLAIAFPEVHFFLADSIAKKIKVVNEAKQVLKLKNVQTINARVEDIAGDFDFITSRAVASAADIVKWTESFIINHQQNEINNGWIFLKGGSLNDEFAFAQQREQVIHLSEFFDSEFFDSKKLIYLPKDF